ncbi:hypothetical protein C9374_012259 [Naegleria lovaniensis]|uniref:RUN domain-containing protein n=1 Tax=Naegleria lovaniensis TaxID=51637 RepID=A0AA88GD46_NAELO|nr:uncharacterized protein C9374_012259 [Naegleria lovaniensis]KAG2373270.1 hypothetical protein C9374_012259 [Naegleria lovaniensis]
MTLIDKKSLLRIKLDQIIEGKKQQPSSSKLAVFLYRNRENGAILFNDEKEEEQILEMAFSGSDEQSESHPCCSISSLPNLLQKRYQKLKHGSSIHSDLISSKIKLRKQFSKYEYSFLGVDTSSPKTGVGHDEIIDVYEEYLEDDDQWISEENHPIIISTEINDKQDEPKSSEVLNENVAFNEYSHNNDYEEFIEDESSALSPKEQKSINEETDQIDDDFIDENMLIATSFHIEEKIGDRNHDKIQKAEEKNVNESIDCVSGEDDTSEFQIFTISPEEFNFNDNGETPGNSIIDFPEPLDMDGVNDVFREGQNNNKTLLDADQPIELEYNSNGSSSASLNSPPLNNFDSFTYQPATDDNNFGTVFVDDHQAKLEASSSLTDIANETDQELSDFQKLHQEAEPFRKYANDDGVDSAFGSLRKHKKRNYRKKRLSAVESNAKDNEVIVVGQIKTIQPLESDFGMDNRKVSPLDISNVSHSSTHFSSNNEEPPVSLVSLHEFLQEDAVLIDNFSKLNHRISEQKQHEYLETPSRQHSSQTNTVVQYEELSPTPPLFKKPTGWEEPLHFLHTEKPLLVHPMLDKLRRTIIDMIDTALNESTPSSQGPTSLTNTVIVMDRGSRFLTPLIHSIYAILLNRPKSSLFKGERDLCGIFSKLTCLKEDNVMQEFLAFKEIRSLHDQKKLKERDLLLIQYLLQRKLLAYCTFELVNTPALLSESYEETSLLNDRAYARPFFAILNLLKKHVNFELRFEFDKAGDMNNTNGHDIVLVTSLQQNIKTLLQYIVQVGKAENLTVELVTDESKNHNLGRVVRTLLMYPLKSILSDKLVLETKWLNSGNFVSHPWQLIVVCAQGPLSKVGVNLKTGHSFQNIVLTIDSLVKRKNQTKTQLMDDKFFSFVIYCLNYQILFEAMKFIFKNIVILEKNFLPQSVMLNIQAQETILSYLQPLSKIRFTLNFY